MIVESFHLSFIGPGGPEFLVVMLVLLVMFGAKDAPRIFRKLNDMLSQFRRTAESFKHEMMYSDIKADPGMEEDLGEYEDYGLGADDEPGDESGETGPVEQDAAAASDEHEGDDVKSI